MMIGYSNFAFGGFDFSDQISVKTSKSSYYEGEHITISGSVKSIILGEPISIQIFYNENLADIAQTEISQTGEFSYVIDPLFLHNFGKYTVKVSYGPLMEVQTTFNYLEKKSSESQSTSTNEMDGLQDLSWMMVSDDVSRKDIFIGQSLDYVDDIGYLHIIGEVINNKNQAVQFVKIVASIYDSEQNLVDTTFTYTMISIIPPYGKSPFDLVFMGGSEGVATYNLQSEYSTTEELPMKLDVKKPRMTIDELGYVHIKGEVANLGDKTAHYVKVTGNLYDSTQKLIGTSFTYTTLSDIYPSGKSPYELIFIGSVGRPTSYQIYVESQEYGMIFTKPVDGFQETPEIRPSSEDFNLPTIKERNCTPNRICVIPDDYLIYENPTDELRTRTEIKFGDFIDDNKIKVQITLKIFHEDPKINKALGKEITDNEILDLRTGFTEKLTSQNTCCTRVPYVVKIPIKLGEKMPSGLVGETPEIFQAENVIDYKGEPREVVIAKGRDLEWIFDKETGVSFSNSIMTFGEKDENHLIDTNIIQPKNTVITEEKIPVPTQETSKEAPSGGCLIATAAFGSEISPQVQQLRELRDNYLMKTESGSSFMAGFNQFYYSFSPTIADWERQNPVFKEAVKIGITPLLTSLSILNYVDMDSEAKVLGYGISLILLNIGMYIVAPIGLGLFLSSRKSKNS